MIISKNLPALLHQACRKNSPSDLGQLASREPFYRNIIDNFFPADKSSQVLDLGVAWAPLYILCIQLVSKMLEVWTLVLK